MKLKIDNVSKTFNNHGKIHRVLTDISFQVADGEFITLLGPSGCGKTTMLTIIAGFQTADTGVVKLDDKVITAPGPDRAFVFQNYALFPWMTVEDNIRFPMVQMKVSKEKQNILMDYLLEISNLKGHEKLYPHQISGGMKQRTALVRALANMPKVLLMDEPLGALDMRMRQKLQSELEEIWTNEKLTIIMVTHDVEEAVYLSDRVILMSTNEGEIVVNQKIDLERPRNRTSPEFLELVRTLSDKISLGDFE